jgi:predicted Zn-dependent peptidase
MLGLESMGSRMMRIGRQELYYGRYYSLDEILELVNGVTVADITKAAADLFQKDQFSEIRLIPTDNNGSPTG